MKKIEPVVWHKGHKQEIVLGPFGPHAGKVVCVKCKGKFVRWATKAELGFK